MIREHNKALCKLMQFLHNEIPIIIIFVIQERNCLLSQSGLEYMGTISEGSDGEKCEYWNNTGLPSNILSSISDVNEVLFGKRTSYSRRCFNFNGDPNGPWCYRQTNQKMPCNIQYCGS